MEMTLKRVQLDPDVTIGRFSTDKNDWTCWTCEDVVRPDGAPKVHGQTAIPAGRYAVIRTFSPHFQKVTPRLVDVPGFEGILIHPGNKASDTEGCLLPGLDRLDKGVGRSVAAFTVIDEMITAALDTHEDVFITIED